MNVYKYIKHVMLRTKKEKNQLPNFSTGPIQREKKNIKNKNGTIIIIMIRKKKKK